LGLVSRDYDNLKGFDIDLPRDALIVITRLPGSGKRKLAFDTIFEGQRRYVESLSACGRRNGTRNCTLRAPFQATGSERRFGGDVQERQGPMSKKSVLLVEDEILLCWVVEDALSGCGYQVFTLTTGNEGLKALEGSRSFDALVTNIKLADGPDGWALARRAREIDPSIAVLYVSGDSIAGHDENGVEGSKMLAKPFDPDKLCQSLADLIGGRE